MTNEVHFFRTDDFETRATRLRVPQIALGKLYLAPALMGWRRSSPERASPGSVSVFPPPPADNRGVVERSRARAQAFRVNGWTSCGRRTGARVLVLGSCGGTSRTRATTARRRCRSCARTARWTTRCLLTRRDRCTRRRGRPPARSSWWCTGSCPRRRRFSTRPSASRSTSSARGRTTPCAGTRSGGS